MNCLKSVPEAISALKSSERFLTRSHERKHALLVPHSGGRNCMNKMMSKKHCSDANISRGSCKYPEKGASEEPYL